MYNREWLQKAYVDGNRNAAQVAAMIGCTNGAVLDALHRFNLPVKTVSTAHTVGTQSGSHAPRPRVVFASTLHNREWMLRHVQAGTSSAEMAREAGCASVTVKQSLVRMDLYERWGAARGRSVSAPLPRRSTFKDSEQGWRTRARNACPPGPCVACGFQKAEINHRDGNIRNDDPSNLERLCRLCHRKQHAMEMKVALRLLEERGILRVEISALAEAELRKQHQEGKNRWSRIKSLSARG